MNDDWLCLCYSFEFEACNLLLGVCFGLYIKRWFRKCSFSLSFLSSYILPWISKIEIDLLWVGLRFLWWTMKCFWVGFYLLSLNFIWLLWLVFNYHSYWSFIISNDVDGIASSSYIFLIWFGFSFQTYIEMDIVFDS